jgi:hypothetical protein
MSSPSSTRNGTVRDRRKPLSLFPVIKHVDAQSSVVRVGVHSSKLAHL